MAYFRRLSNPMFANCLHAKCQHRQYCSGLNVILIFHQILANLPQNATGIVRNFKTFKIWVSLEKKFFEKKSWFFIKIAKGRKFAVECDWNSKKSQNVWILDFFGKNINWFFWKKTLKFFKNATCGNFFLQYASDGFFLLMSFHLIFEVFWQKSEKI